MKNQCGPMKSIGNVNENTSLLFKIKEKASIPKIKINKEKSYIEIRVQLF